VEEGGVRTLLLSAQRRFTELTINSLRVLASLLDAPSARVSFQPTVSAAVVLCDELLHHGTREEKEQAVCLLSRLYSPSDGAEAGVMQSYSLDNLVHLLNASESEKSSLTVIKAICTLSSDQQMVHAIAAAGGVRALLRTAFDHEGSPVGDAALAALRQMGVPLTDGVRYYTQPFLKEMQAVRVPVEGQRPKKVQ
jgi:hypothetical protein